jgi:tetraacyldisaccharide 4'-kinase
MRSDREQQMTRIWYGGEAPSPWLRALSPVYALGNRLDRWWQTRRRPGDLGPACIVVVGNITAGGSGKTPLVIRLCRLLREAGIRAGVVSRGYGRSDSTLRQVGVDSDPAEVGDEPLLIARRAGVPVIVAADRCAAAQALLEKQVQVVVADDGLQHYRLPRDIEICVVDGERGFGNGRLLPAGPLREPLERLADVDHVVINGEQQIAVPAGPSIAHMQLAGNVLRSLDDDQSWRLSQFAGCRVNAVAAIGNPGRFFELLRHARIRVVEHAFPDHHAFRNEDFAAMAPDLPILMTEKDAVKCYKLGLRNAWALPVEAALPYDWEQALLGQIRETLAKGRERA